MARSSPLVTIAPAAALAAVVADASSVLGPVVLAASFESVSYLACFIAIGA